MSLKSLLRGWLLSEDDKPKENKTTYSFSDEDRRQSAEIRKKKQEIELMRMTAQQELENLKLEKERMQLQAQIDELQEMYEDEEPEQPQTDPLMMMLLPILQNLTNKGNISPSQMTTPSNVTAIAQPLVLSDEEIKQTIATMTKDIPKAQLLMLKKLPDNIIRNELVNKLSGYSEDTYTRAINIFKGS